MEDFLYRLCTDEVKTMADGESGLDNLIAFHAQIKKDVVNKAFEKYLAALDK